MSVESEIVDIAITQDTLGLQRLGFGVPLFLSPNASFAERVRYYGGADELADDGFASTSPERRLADALFGQELKPTQLAIGRCANKPIMRYAVGVQVLRNSDSSSYKLNVGGEGFTETLCAYTTDSSATEQEIHNALVTALNAVASKNYLATFAPLTISPTTFTADNTTEIFTATAHGLKTGDGPFQVSNSGGALPTGLLALTNYWVIRIDANTFYLATSLANALAGTFLTISTNGTGTQTIDDATAFRPFDPFLVTGSSAGNWFFLEILDVTALSSAITHADPGVAADLDAIELEQPAWYCLLTGYNSKAYVGAAAAWVEAQEDPKIYGFDVPETEAIQVAVGSGTDTLATSHTAGYTRTFGSYHHRPGAFFTAAWAGDILPDDPGEDTWALKPLVGVGLATTKLTTTNRNNLRARNANWCTTAFGKQVTFQGMTFDGDFIDIVRGIDWLNDDMTKGLGGLLIGQRKIPMSEQGRAAVLNEVKASIDRATRRHILLDFPKPVITAPSIAQVSDADRAVRLFRDVKFTAQLEGAIHKVTVRGRVSI